MSIISILLPFKEEEKILIEKMNRIERLNRK
jgi:hypothetical protein